MLKMLSCCMNWKVIGALAVTGLGVWVVAPNLVAGLVPVLFVLVCPLSMLLMMPMMVKGQMGMKNQLPGQNQPEEASCCTTPQPQHLNQLSKANLSQKEELAELKAQLANSQLQQEVMVREIAQLELESEGIALDQAEAVAHASWEKQSSHRN